MCIKRSSHIALFFFFLFGLGEIAHAQLGSFANRKKFIVESDSVSGSSDLTNFPVLISITDLDFRDTGNSGSVESSSGFDIAFSAADGTTAMDFELESYDNTTGVIVFWVKFPTLSPNTDTQFFIYYGDSGIATDQSSTSTWDSNYQLVMHMDGGATETDGTVNGNDGTENGTGGVSTTTGQIGTARDFVRADADFINVADDASLDITGSMTISFWFNQSSAQVPDFISKGINLSYETTSRSGVRTRWRKNGSNVLTTGAAEALSTGVWTYLSFIQSSTGMAIYQDGAVVASNSNTTAFTPNNDPLYISRSADAVDGIIDEVRISDTDRTAEWISTEYNNQLTPAAFIEELPDVPGLSNIETSTELYTAGGAAVFITSSLTVDTHPTITDLTSATVVITGNLDNPDDQLNFVDQLGITGSYVDATGTLTLSGTTTLANYQTALRSVTFSSNAVSPSQLTRTISFTGFDGADATNTIERDIDIITTLTDISTDISSNVFHLDAQDVDGDGIANTADGAAISTWTDLSTNSFDFITGNAATYDLEGFGERGSIIFDGAADELVKSVETTINNSIFSQKSFAFVFRTGADVSGFQYIYEQANGTRGYNFSIVDGTLYAQAYSRGDANWGASNAVRHKVLNLGSVSINTSYSVIAIHNSNSWTAQVNNGTFVTDETADDMPAVSETVAVGGNSGNSRHPVTLVNTNGNLDGQIVELASWNTALNGGQIASLNSYFEDKWGNTAPVLAAVEGTAIDFTEGDADTQITNTITVTDADPHLNMDSARVSISANYVNGEDILTFSNTANITGNFNATTGELLLTGSDTKANYQAALRAVNYSNVTVNPTVSTRTVDFEIYDWDDISNTVSRSINVLDVAVTPVLANIEVSDLAYNESDGAVAITSAITLSDFDDTDMESATISISANYTLGEDFLDFTDTGNITGSFASGTGILTLSGTDTEANYQAALRAVTYENTSSDPVELTRTVSILVNDGDNNSNTETRDITVTAANSKPILSSIESGNLAYPDGAVQITNTIVVSDPDNTFLDSAIVIISENFKPAEDSLIYSTIFGITGTYTTTTGRLKLVGNNLLSDYQSALRSIDYKNFATIASGPERVVSFIVSDGTLKSDSLKRTIDVSPVETIPNLEVWLRADAGISEGDGVAVTTWADQSGNSNDYVGVADAGTAPTYVASSSNFNGQPAVSLVGNGDHFLDSDGDVNYIDNATEFSLFVVFKSDVTGSDRGLFIADTPAGSDDILTIRYDASGANGGGSFTDVVKTGILGNTADNQLESFSDIQTTSAQIISLQWESGITYDLYVDGILNNPSSAADPPPSGSISSVDATTAILGKGGKDDPSGANLSWDGEIAEFIFYTRSLSSTERESIEDYLADKYDQAIRKITPATGGESISADDANTSYTALTGPFVQEGFIGEFTASGTYVLTTPSGYEWNTGGTIGVTESPAFGGSTELTSSYNAGSSTSTTLVFDIDAASTTNPGQLEFTGLEIRPTTGTIPNTGNITNGGTTGQGGATNYGTITMVPGANDSLIFTQQPSTTNKDSTITPAVRVQLVDQYGNSIEQAAVDISLALATGSTGVLSQTTPIPTNALGIAEFDTLSIDLIGTKELVATGTGLSPDTTSAFEIVNAGTLTGFTVERVPSGSISSKTAGQTFNIIITAVDGTASTITTFTGTVVISSSCTMGTGQGTSASFTSGVLASTTVSLTSVGTCDITATNSAGSENGTSNTFTVSAGAASETTSIITASPTVILNDGITTSTITVALKDVYGNDLTIGGDAVALTITPTALGSLGSVTDVGDGTYTATLTSSTTAGTDNITGTVNAVTITDDVDVEFAAFTHIWDSQLGSSSDASNWEDTGNWNVGTQPGPSSVVFIPASPSVGNEQPVIDVAGSTIASITMETGASITISGSINFTITGDISGGSVLGTNADSLTVGGDVLNVTTVNVGTVVLNGSTAQSITNPHSYTNLEIDNANGVSIVENLVIADSLRLTSGEILIPSGKNLVADGIAYGSGTLRFQRAVTGDIGWRIISSPVASTFGDFLDGVVTQGYTGAFYDISVSPGDTVQPNVLTYDETQVGTDSQRYRAPTNSTNNLVAGQGMFVFFFDDIPADSRYNEPLPDTLDVAGQEFGTNDEVIFPITYTALADTGWNLVGNPFGATIDWDDGANWTKTNIDATIYIWDPAANGGDGEYLTWNGSTGTLGSGLIAPFQGFWVKANALSPDLRVTTDAKTTGGAFLRKESVSNTPDYPMFELEISSEGLSKRTSVMFSDEGSESLDPLDAYTLLPLVDNRLELHTLLENGTPLAINNLPLSLTNRIKIPLVIRGYEDGTPISADYLLRFINADNLPEDWMVLLIDKETGKEVNLVAEEEQTLFHTTTEKVKVAHPINTPDLFFLESLSTRFTLLVTTEDIEINIPRSVYLDQNYPNPFNPSTQIPFGLEEDADVRLEVFDILGRKVQTLISERRTAGNHTVTFNTGNLASGIYIYRLTTPSRVITKKLSFIK